MRCLHTVQRWHKNRKKWFVKYACEDLGLMECKAGGSWVIKTLGRSFGESQRHKQVFILGPSGWGGVESISPRGWRFYWPSLISVLWDTIRSGSSAHLRFSFLTPQESQIERRHIKHPSRCCFASVFDVCVCVCATSSLHGLWVAHEGPPAETPPSGTIFPYRRASFFPHNRCCLSVYFQFIYLFFHISASGMTCISPASYGFYSANPDFQQLPQHTGVKNWVSLEGGVSLSASLS